MAFSLHIQSKQKLNFKLSQRNRHKNWTIIPLNMTTSFFLVILVLNQLNQQLEIFVKSMAVKTQLKTTLVSKIRKTLSY